MHPAAARAASPVRGRATPIAPGADSPPPSGGPGTGERSPSAPALTSTAGRTGTEEPASSAPAGEVDPLVGNGLTSPLCSDGERSPTDASNCATSGFVAAAAPTGDYGIDVHVETGLLGLSEGALLNVVQEVLVAPVWMILVWSVHALVVLLEWAFSLDLLDGRSVAGLGAGLRHMEASLTTPWLALVLAVASVLSAYNGLIRRRVGETLGQALMAVVMMASGLWVIADPVGTIGAIAGWSNQASLGTLAVASQGTPAAPGRALADGLGGIFAATVEAPWCYMEFGDVAWCREPARQDPRLRHAGIAIAGSELALAGCRPDPLRLLPCAGPGSAQAKVLENSARLLRSARTNAALFLALPADGWARNSISNRGSLLRVLCGAAEATSCKGPTAAQAEFRTNSGTWPRFGGLILIAAGALGMLLLLGYIALRLFVAAILSLLLLLAAPAAVLAPALGEGGRDLFRRWGGQLLGAVASKLLFAFLLGLTLGVGGLLTGLPGLGWWTHWLLGSAFWWTAFLRRHQALGLAHGALGGEQRHQGALVRRTRAAIETTRSALHIRKMLRERFQQRAPEVGARRSGASARVERLESELRHQARGTFEHEQREAGIALSGAPRAQRQLSERRTQLARVRREITAARESGERQRELRLEHRARGIETTIDQQQANLTSARTMLRTRPTRSSPGRSASAGELSLSRAEVARREAFLDAQLALPRARDRRAGSQTRDYLALAGLVGRGPAEYLKLDPSGRRRVRLEIDRELEVRRELTAKTGDLVEGAGGDPEEPRHRRAAGRQAEREIEETRRRLGAPRRTLPSERTPVERWRDLGRPSSARSDSAAQVEGPARILDDAREVAARRKRQLGFDRP
jgi:hypothetical protein